MIRDSSMLQMNKETGRFNTRSGLNEALSIEVTDLDGFGWGAALCG